ncbi:hypothetical protein BBO99_00007069 [Phytophthora kernoviae]|uniref:DUF4833 domain-containing protein n=2 Tax=Phytophthora kernoviae TaxID=325452 RepID=A0A3R7ND27_9STRA|nr:hypothetical protein G195_007542 [Phytophthora kernoviae 00238/432]KAG2521346.1 hypothetical protein JM16_006280 [Phytophthora kernoviae]KAG2522433.1 hypothetical protein JM18_006146 [Phytophthora kernoviae]RLM96862.1 hypothetical protein BBI17_005228 [Phytophthora kernoviae]RLN77031.1 hypothetical protein BBO99_00007069 [Phytophthora kernoviae]
MSLDFSKVENNPVPLIAEKHNSNVAFVVYRNKNKNVVVYAANLREDGTLDPENPLDVYWIMFEQDGAPREDLNMIERNTAYGATVKPREGHPGQFEVTLTSLKDRVIYLSIVDGKVVGHGTINGQENCTLERVFVYSTTSWGLPKVQHIEIHGHDASGNAIMEKKLPLGDVVEDSAVNDFLLILEEHRKNCERQGKYVEAEIAKNRLEELKVHEENRRKEAMRSRQIAERLGVEEAHMLEFQQFNQVWDRKMDEYERNVEDLVINMREKHKSELLEFQQKLLEKHQKPKFSKDLLNLRRIEEHLARQKDYGEAHKIKLKSDALEAWELEKWRNLKQQEMFQREVTFKQRQKQDLDALQKRIQSGREEQKKQRQVDLERLLQRYQNVKAELQQQQNLERIRHEKFVQRPGGVAR